MAAITVDAAPNVIRRLTATLFAGQSIASLGMTSAITIGSIAATQLWGTTAFAGVPTTVYVLGTALGAYGAGRLMHVYGRRRGLTLGFLLGVAGAALAAYSLIGIIPVMLFAAYFCMGLSRGTLDQGRFAAGDMVLPGNRARAIGWVVLGGTIGGIGGPLFIAPASRWAQQLGYDPLSGPYLASAGLFVLGSAMIFLVLRPDPHDIGRHLIRLVTPVHAEPTGARSFPQALGFREIQTALAAMVLGQVVMTTVMVMTPLQMTEHLHHTLDAVSLVIAAHVTGMYATSVITGRVADKLGQPRTILMGACLLILSCVLAPFATDTVRLAFALFILGAGWNFCFVAGSSLLTNSLRPNERAPIQGASDLTVGLVAATGSLSSGFAFETVGYPGIALAGITLAVILFAITLWQIRRPHVTAQ